MKEMRIGLVLYGGVSLAVYMNGVVTEIWQLLRASLSRRQAGSQVDGTAAVYRDLIDNLQKLSGAADLRIVVDTIAGTSAGGVNGLVLGKAIATGGDARVLNRIWVEGAGIERLAAPPPKRTPWYLRPLTCAAACLLACRKSGSSTQSKPSFRKKFRDVLAILDETPGIDRAWARDHAYSVFASDDAERTPLDGGYFTRMIADALESMTNTPIGSALLPPGGRFDLVLTRTDLYGWPRHLPVDPRFHADLLETAHAHRMRFRHRRPLNKADPALVNDFDDDFALTYAARSTASFPAAFAPVGYASASKSYRRARSLAPPPDRNAFASRHLPEHLLHAYGPDTAWMIDGGVLDNKPFSAVTRLIEEKPADRNVYRVLIYIEPDPSLAIEPPPEDMPHLRKMPGLLYKLFRHEPIHADLEAIAARNRLVERLVRIAEAAETDARRMMQPDLDAVPLGEARLDTLRWMVNQLVRRGHNPAYPGYTMLKAKRAADTLARFVSDSLGYPYESKHAYFLREIVRSWLAQRGALDPPTVPDHVEDYRSSDEQLKLLGAFDVPYRLRRLRNMVRIANTLYEENPDEADPVDDLKRKLMSAAAAFDRLAEWVGERGEQIRDRLQGALETDDLDRYIREFEGQPSDIAVSRGPELDDLYDMLKDHFRSTLQIQGRHLREAIANLPDTLREPIARAYVLYPMIDLAVFPPMDSAGIGDLTATSVLRISPHDARALSADPHRLKSREIGAFAGFLRKGAREHDLLWGRLDGAERLIDQIVAAAVSETNDDQVRALRADALTAATEAILDEFEPGESSEVQELIETLRTRLPIPPAGA